MFGRFGRGGGNFVAQYRVYPVSFVDKVRLLPSPARAVPQSRATVTHPRSRDARESSPDGSGPSVPPSAALTPSTPLATSQSSRRTRLRMETRVSHREDGPFAPEAQTLAPLGHLFKTSDGSRAANSDPRLTPPAPSPPAHPSAVFIPPSALDRLSESPHPARRILPAASTRPSRGPSGKRDTCARHTRAHSCPRTRCPLDVDDSFVSRSRHTHPPTSSVPNPHTSQVTSCSTTR